MKFSGPTANVEMAELLSQKDSFLSIGGYNLSVARNEGGTRVNAVERTGPSRLGVLGRGRIFKKNLNYSLGYFAGLVSRLKEKKIKRVEASLSEVHTMGSARQIGS